MATAERMEWVRMLERVAGPVLGAMAQGRLGALMPVAEGRRWFARLEALGRVLAGIGPWLEGEGGSAEEAGLRERMRVLARGAIGEAVDAGSADACNFSEGHQPVVDAAFLAQGLLRAPKQLVGALAGPVKERLADALEATRGMAPLFNNWLLFSAMIEAGLALLGREPDLMRIDYAIRQHEQWYKGDGAYGDGPEFHFDYYNSFVIHPMLLDLLDAMHGRVENWHSFEDRMVARAQRYAAVLERMIGVDGTFVPMGRSLAYRCGAFHLLGQLAWQKRLPGELEAGQVRRALGAVMARTLGAAGTFDEAGFLRVGLAGYQPGLGEGYISTGSLYLCATVFLPLGLPAGDAFWTEAGRDWTQRRVWGGEDGAADHAL